MQSQDNEVIDVEPTKGELRRFGGAVAEAKPQEDPQFFSLVRALATNPDVPIEKMQAILDMKNSEEDRAAERAFNAAFARVSAEMVPVIATSENDHTQSTYAKLGGLISSAGPIIGKHGLSIRYYEMEATKPDHVKVGATVSHEAGHSEKYYRELPYDDKGSGGKVNKTQIHGNQSAFSYAVRYMFATIFNIPVVDDDGNAAGGNKSRFITTEQAAYLKAQIQEHDVDVNLLLKSVGALNIDALPSSQLKKTMMVLHRKTGGKIPKEMPALEAAQ